jgi:hypothetical protein
VHEPLNPNPVISPPHTYRCPLLLRICFHHVPSTASSACASTSSPRSSSMSKRSRTAPCTQPSPPHQGTTVGTTLLPPRPPPSPLPSPPHTRTAIGTTLLLCQLLHHRDHPDRLHLQQFVKTSPSLLPSPSVNSVLLCLDVCLYDYAQKFINLSFVSMSMMPMMIFQYLLI